MALIMVTAFSCSPEDGADGAQGAQGPAGQDGTNGEDGNANVQAYIFNNPAWGSASGMNIDMAGILTDEVINNDAILTYVKHSSTGTIGVIPGSVWNGNYRDYAVFLKDSSDPNPENITIVSLEMNGSFTPNANLWGIDWVKVVIIESSNTTAKSLGKQGVFNELKAAGVDINNYNEVMDYYGLDY